MQKGLKPYGRERERKEKTGDALQRGTGRKSDTGRQRKDRNLSTRRDKQDPLKLYETARHKGGSLSLTNAEPQKIQLGKEEISPGLPRKGVEDNIVPGASY